MRIFGTDGIRGKANTELTPELATSLGRAVVSALSTETDVPLIYIGRDTRVSGDMLALALAAGCMSAGANVVDLGVLPTPALAYLTKNGSATIGAMISASHNPAIDNGIKFFTHAGFKLPDAVEDTIEALVRSPAGAIRVTGDSVGTYSIDTGMQEQYFQYLKDTAAISLQGLKVVVDAANGASFNLAPRLLNALGAKVVAINAVPNGININVKSGSTHPQALAGRVIEAGADLGLAFDGDADRLIACDADGAIVDGDNMLHICAMYLKQTGDLNHKLVVGTVMSNLGLDAVLQREDISLIRASVGDRYVLQEMLACGAVLGGEQSGHCIFLNHSTTGDGMLTAVMLLKAMSQARASLKQLAAGLKRYPQVLINVPVRDKCQAMNNFDVKEAIEKAEIMVKSRGRILVRPSGTERIVRVMVEAETEDLAVESANVVVDALNKL
ncbi:MAG: phosphoglucosamine mutase [Bacillota bacterium]|nr:MAG: phosphoglucosamine mutase [Bacillota bacterium]